MVIPEKVKILYKEYRVESESNIHNGANDLYGQINYLDERISLLKESSLEQKKATLIHEVIHGLDEMYSIGLKEKQVEKLGNAFYMLIRDNPDLFERSDAI